MLHDVERREERADLRHVAAEIAKARAAHREEMTFGVERKLAVELLRAAMMIGEE